MATLQSPRIENGVLKWYEGDAFYIDYELKNEETGEIVETDENDGLVIEFYCGRKKIRSFNLEKIEESVYQLHIDARSSKLFTVGEYAYTVELHKNNSQTIQTIENCGRAIVEGICQCKK